MVAAAPVSSIWMRPVSRAPATRCITAGNSTTTMKPAGEDERDHVDRGRQQEQGRGTLGGPARRRASLDQQQHTDSLAGGPAERYGRVERQFGQRDSCAEPYRGPLKHLQEREHVAQARKDLENDRRHQPRRLHVLDDPADAVEARDREQQAHGQHHQQRE
jgi:hypothetical protein